MTRFSIWRPTNQFFNLGRFYNTQIRVLCYVNASIKEGSVPYLWKCTDVLPLSKVPKPKNVDSDLRPISLTPVLSKVLEGFASTWLCPFVMPTVDPRQSSEIKNSFTIHCLVHLLHHWLSVADAPNTIVRSCLIDFSEAFDQVDHNILI